MAAPIFTDIGKTYILDGGLGSTLQNVSETDVESDPLWTSRLILKNPRAIILVHEEFIKSGADIITTASYQGSVEGFRIHLQKTEEEAIELLGKSVLLANRATEITNREVIVAGSIGPYGAFMNDGSEYTGEHVGSMTEADLMEWHRPRLQALVRAGCKLLAIETQPCVKEAIAILKLVAETESTRAWVSFSCRDSERTSGGDNIVEAIVKCYKQAPDRLDAVGVNCCSPEIVTPILAALRNCYDLPSPTMLARIVYPNSGEKWVSGSGWMESSRGKGADVSKWDVKEWERLGARIIGGCCRVGPNSISQISHKLKQGT